MSEREGKRGGLVSREIDATISGMRPKGRLGWSVIQMRRDKTTPHACTLLPAKKAKKKRKKKKENGKETGERHTHTHTDTHIHIRGVNQTEPYWLMVFRPKRLMSCPDIPSLILPVCLLMCC